jgi:hypothetical protein
MSHYLGGCDVEGVAFIPSCTNALGARVVAHDGVERSAYDTLVCCIKE